MRFIDMFAGIGGFHLGMEQADHQCVGWIEWDKFARQSYQAIHNVKGVWNASDIRTVRASELPRADCWCFGFPCQDISVAGKQKGFTAGKRSSLFFTVTGLIRDLEEEDRPSYLLIENVKNLLSINRGLDFLKLQIELDEIGYDVEWDVIDSASFVPQHRERVFIIGHLRGKRTRKVFPIIRKGGKTTESNVIKVIGNTSNTGFRSEDVLDSTGISTTLMSRDYKGPKQVAIKQVGNISNSKSFGGNPQVGRVYGTDGISPTLSTMQGGGQEPKILNDYRIRKLTPLETWRLQGFPDWAFERAKQAGLSDSQLYKQAGNSVTVPVIKAIAENMAFETFGECLK
ncbi:DNA cytosine methyltransferase [Lactiplantibacillus plantarum]